MLFYGALFSARKEAFNSEARQRCSPSLNPGVFFILSNEVVQVVVLFFTFPAENFPAVAMK